MEIFTPETNSLKETKSEEKSIEEGLNDDDQEFYQTIKPTLNEMIKNPKDETLSKIMNYSKTVE